MHLKRSVSIAAPLDKVWEAINNPEIFTSCLPAASLTANEGDSFIGTWTVKFGPFSLTYRGRGTYVERNTAAHRVVIETNGRELRGNGTINATVTGMLAAEGQNETKVTVITDLTMTGRPAQTMHGDVPRLLNQTIGHFVPCMTDKLTQLAGEDAIFISYRRSDQAGMAARLYEKLVAKFGRDRLFIDVDSIELGADFAQVVEYALGRCRIFIAVIGPDWLMAEDEFGSRRLDNPNDYVRLEIESALGSCARVIPILIDDTRMPREAELPNSIKALARRNACQVSTARLDMDCVELIFTLYRIMVA